MIDMRAQKKSLLIAALFLCTLTAIGALLIGVGFFAKKSSLPQPPEDALYTQENVPIEERIDNLMSYMTLAEKIGQMVLVEKNSVKDVKHIAQYGIGAVLSGGGGKPKENTTAGWKTMVSEFTDAARQSRLAIPLLYGSDANHGNGNVPQATIFPHAIGLGASGDAILVRRIGEITARESAALGIYWNFSPSLDMPEDIRWGRVYEAFGSDPKMVAALGHAYITGLQGQEGEGIHVLGSAKHYLGVGSMEWGTSYNKDYSIDQGVTDPDLDKLEEIYSIPFRAAVDAGVMSVMAGLNSWGSERITGSNFLINQQLKEELGFQGFVVSDWYGVYDVAANEYDAIVKSINAGIDMAMLPYDYRSFIRHVERAVEVGDIPLERIDDAVRRILRAKFALGLFDTRATEDSGVVGSLEHRAVAREAVRKSLVLLKNNSALPITNEVKTIYVVGSAADNVGMQAGGWTVDWQGVNGNVLPGATSILKGILEVAGPETRVEYDAAGVFDSAVIADIGIAVVGEAPYAEGWGDSAYPALTAADLAAIENVRTVSKQVVVVIISGRPLFITEELGSWDAVVAAWLPGSEGAGVADTLFGRYSFTGTLPLAWPRFVEQLPISTSGETANGSSVLFPRGYGL